MLSRRTFFVESLERRLLLTSNGWDGVGLGRASLSYYVGDLESNLDANEIRETIDAALAVWSEVADLEFGETTQAGQRDSIDIDFDEIDGAGGTLAQAFLPDDVNRGRIAGDITFDSEETWEVGNARRSSATDLMLVAVHEIGHALGLEHSDNVNSVMYAAVSPNAQFRGLDESDVDSILQLYARRPSDIPGDFDDDGVVTAEDIDLMAATIRAGDFIAAFDVNEDRVVDASDREALIEDVLETTYGDANLDGAFDSSDLVAVFQAGRFENDSVGDSGWSTGDWNGDGAFDTSDIVLAFQRGDFLGDA